LLDSVLGNIIYLVKFLLFYLFAADCLFRRRKIINIVKWLCPGLKSPTGCPYGASRRPPARAAPALAVTHHTHCRDWQIQMDTRCTI